MSVLILVLPLLFVIIIANLIDRYQSRPGRLLFATGMIAFQLLILITALLLLATPEINDLFASAGLTFRSPSALSLTLIFMSLWGILACIGPVRALLARILPIDPASTVHMLALVLTGWMIGNTLLALSLDGLEGLADLVDTVAVSDLVLQQLGFVLLAFVGVGVGIRRSLPDTLQRLGLVRPTLAHLRLGLMWMLGMLAIQWAIGIVWVLIDPEQAELLSNINEAFLSDIDSLPEWFLLAASAGIGEETLFRGALQPVLGLGFTSVLFALVHVQYGFTPVTIAVFIIGLALGILRNRTNTTTAILVHFGYNFTLGLLSLLAAFAEQFAP